MIHEHALRKIEFYLQQNCLNQEIRPMVDNIVCAAERGYSQGSYHVKGHFVVAPKEDNTSRANVLDTETLWPFGTESQARQFLLYLKAYFEVRGVRADLLGIEGFSLHG